MFKNILYQSLASKGNIKMLETGLAKPIRKKEIDRMDETAAILELTEAVATKEEKGGERERRGNNTQK